MKLLEELNGLKEVFKYSFFQIVHRRASELNGWKEVIKGFFFQLIQIKSSDLNKLHMHYPELEKWIRYRIPARFIYLDEDML